MLLEALCLIGAGIAAKAAIENPDKAKKFANSFAKTAEKAAMSGRGNLSDEEREKLLSDAQRLRSMTETHDEYE